MAHIKLKKLTGIQVKDNKVVASSPKVGETLINSTTGIQALSIKDDKIIFAGQDYKGTFTASGAKVGKEIEGSLELYLERPENHFTINSVKINIDSNAAHTFTGTGKDGGATILLETSTPTITEKDSGWFTTELTGTPKTLKFGEWSNYDLPNQSYLEIDFA